jgi:LDH2 family malate/lactate/ureidoglycolate dehydrogenase
MMPTEKSTLPLADLQQIATKACLASGASHAMATSLVEATLSAACLGRPDMGFPHVLDYLHSLREGRIDGHAEPHIDHVLPAFIHCDARGGIAQLGFDLIFKDLVERAWTFGIGIFTQKNSCRRTGLLCSTPRLGRADIRCDCQWPRHSCRVGRGKANILYQSPCLRLSLAGALPAAGH